MSEMTAQSAANSDIARWNLKYQKGQSRKIEPKGEPELMALADLLDNEGLALDMAAGRGRTALFLAELGYRVIACDGAEAALSGCSRFARDHGLNVSCMVCDLETYRFSEGQFDLLVVVRYLNRKLLPILPSWIRPGGWLFYKTFNSRFLMTNPGFNPEYTVEPGELDEIFSGLDIHASDTKRGGLVSDERMSFVFARKPPGND